MKQLTHWILALLAVATVASFSGAWTSVQEPPKQQEPPKKEKLGPAGQGKRPQQRGRAAEKHEALRKVMPTLKTSLSEAIGLAEKETGGKAFSAGVEIMQGKPLIAVNLFVGEKFTVTSVDPETKKVTVAAKKGEGDDEGEGEGGEGGGGGTGGGNGGGGGGGGG